MIKNLYQGKKAIAFALSVLLIVLFVSCQNAPVIPSSSVDDSSVTYNEETEKTIPDVQVAGRIRASEIKNQQFAPVIADCPELARFINDDALYRFNYTPDKVYKVFEGEGDLKIDAYYFMSALYPEIENAEYEGVDVCSSRGVIKYDCAIIAGAIEGDYGYEITLDYSTLSIKDIKYDMRYVGRYPTNDPLFDVYIATVSFKLDTDLPELVSGEICLKCLSDLTGDIGHRRLSVFFSKCYDDVYVWHNKQGRLSVIEEHPEIGRAEYMKYFRKNHVNRKMTLHTDEEKGYKTVAESGWDGEIFTDTRAREYLSDGHSEIYYKIVYDWSTYLTDGYCMVESTYEGDTQLSRLEDIHPEITDTNDIDSKFLVTRVPVSE